MYVFFFSFLRDFIFRVLVHYETMRRQENPEAPGKAEVKSSPSPKLASILLHLHFFENSEDFYCHLRDLRTYLEELQKNLDKTTQNCLQKVIFSKIPTTVVFFFFSWKAITRQPGKSLRTKKLSLRSRKTDVCTTNGISLHSPLHQNVFHRVFPKSEIFKNAQNYRLCFFLAIPAK